MNTLLAEEVCNRFLALPLTARTFPLAIIMRLTVEVTRELLERSPESVDEFLRLCATQPGGLN